MAHKEAYRLEFEGMEKITDPDGGDRQVVCSQRPLNFTEANVNFMLAWVAMGPGDFTKSGRKVIVAAKSGVSVVSSGKAQYVAILNTGLSALLVVKKCVEVSLAALGTVDIPSWKCSF